MRLRAAFSAVVAVAAVSCSQAGAADQFELVEFAVNGPTTLAGAETTTVTNAGKFAHTLVVTDQSGQVVAATPLLQPGDSVDLSLGLDPGTYSFTCRIVAQTPEGMLVDHFEQGMAASVDIAD